jgi:hypothetical protein
MASPEACICGCRAWFLSRVTWLERLRFALGIDRDGDLTQMELSDKPIAGNTAMMRDHWPAQRFAQRVAGKEKESDGNLTA